MASLHNHLGLCASLCRYTGPLTADPNLEEQLIMLHGNKTLVTELCQVRWRIQQGCGATSKICILFAMSSTPSVCSYLFLCVLSFQFSYCFLWGDTVMCLLSGALKFIGSCGSALESQFPIEKSTDLGNFFLSFSELACGRKCCDQRETHVLYL
jgi:hypothetical protein